MDISNWLQVIGLATFLVGLTVYPWRRHRHRPSARSVRGTNRTIAAGLIFGGIVLGVVGTLLDRWMW